MAEALVQNLFALVRKRFRQLERSEGLTQQALADRMCLTRSQISRWMASPANMTLRSAGKLLWAMGCQLELRVVDPFAASQTEQ
jgi:transcriptional regulator with XRE-family HTH domain